MQLHHFDELSPHLVHASCILRLRESVGDDAVRAFTAHLLEANVLEEVAAEVGEGDARTRFIVGSWVPRTELAHAAAIERLRTLEEAGVDAAWLFSVTTTVDQLIQDEGDGDAQPDGDGDSQPEGDANGDAQPDGDGDGDGDGDVPPEDEQDSDAEVTHWRHGPPPGVQSVPFPLEGYPAILEDFDSDDFGVALKLAAPVLPGVRAVLHALHQAWMAAYADRRADERPFRNTSVAFDPTHGAAVFWVDEFTPPATVAQIAHHAMWILAAVHDVVPIAHARFSGASLDQKYGAQMGRVGPPFVLAGNPLRGVLEAEDEAGAERWAAAQTTWSTGELAAMYVEVGTDFDPDDPEQSEIAVRRFERAATLDPTNKEAAPYAQVALVRGGRVPEAIAQGAGADAATRAHIVALVAEHATRHLREALPLLDTDAFDAGPEEQIADALAAVASHVPDALPDVLARVPQRGDIVAHVFNASFRCDDVRVRLMLLEFAMDLPVPDPGPHREAFTYAHNNACVLAHQIGDFPRAAQLADLAQQWADENPYIFHGAACAYVGVGRMDDAMRQVERALAVDYDNLEQLEADADLGALRSRPEFAALFTAWRERIARSEPVRTIDAAEFDTAVLESDLPVLVDFTATWCGPCKSQAPILERLARGSAGRFRILTVDIDANPELAGRHDATSVPTLVVFHGGRELGRRVGLSTAAELEAMLAAARGGLN